MSNADMKASWAKCLRQALDGLYTPEMTQLPDEVQAEYAEMDAERLLAIARHWMGIACPVCGGTGRRCYGSSAGWRGGCGGQTLTDDVCDRCWGTGRTDRTGVDLRKLRNSPETKK